MKFVFVALVSIFIFSDANAALTCARFFELDTSFGKELKRRTETSKGSRYFKVRGYRHLQGSELDLKLQKHTNLVQVADNLPGIVSHTRNDSPTWSIPSDAYYIANRIVPLIVKFLQDHNVNYRKETYEKNGVTKTDIIITSEGTNYLNKLAAKLEVERTSLRINPVHLVYQDNGFNAHYRQSEGRFYNVDGYNPGYELSFSTLRHSQDKDFRGNILAADPNLEVVSQQLAWELRQAKSEADFLGREEQARQDELQEGHQKKVDHIQSLIDKARNKNSGTK